MIRILLVDDHALFRSGMSSILNAQQGMSVVAEAENGEDAVSLMRDNPLDVVLMDVNMPGIGGIEATRRIVRHDPQSRVIALTAMNDLPFPNQLLDAGAVGYLTKGCSAEELSLAVNEVMQGKHFICNEVAQRLCLSGLIDKGRSTPVSTLSAREMQIMLMVSKGQTTQEIADLLYISPKTVSTYRTRLFEKLEVQNDVELTHFALSHGLVELNG